MSNLWKAISELAVSTHPDRIVNVADALAVSDSALVNDKIIDAFGPNVDKTLINQFISAWVSSPLIGSKEIASAFRAASEVVSLMESRESIELVWTGPKTGLVSTRNTEQVLCEVIESAKDRLFVVSFVAYEIPLINLALQEATKRKVRVDILLESSIKKGGKVDVDSAKMLKTAVPLANIYSWKLSGSKGSISANGVVHAKCAVADGNIAFITSANLSKAAMDRNMELGILVRGGSVTDQLHRHLEALITTETVQRV